MRTYFIICILRNISSVEIECKDKDSTLCVKADCGTPVGRLICPKKCGLCQSSCQDSGQHCDVANCDTEAARVACPRSCK